MSDKATITVCMGSSCFARGNAENLEYIEKFIKENNLDAEIELSGSRCENKYALGPNVLINGKMYNNVDKETLKKLMESIK